jgi:Fe-S oxidoreductase
MWIDEKIGRRINIARVEQALPHGPRVIATACPYCSTMMSDGLKALGPETTIETRDIAELVAAALEEKAIEVAPATA